MNDEVAGQTKSDKAAANRPVARMLVRAIWAQERNLSHPGETVEERSSAWAKVRDEMMQKNLALYSRALAALRKAGVTFTQPGPIAKAAAKDAGGEG